MVRVVNIKEDNPPSDIAVFNLSVAINDAKKMGEKALIVIHGYGSHGKGGLIKKETLRFLEKIKHSGEISDFVLGENWGEFNEQKKSACEKCPELILHSQLSGLNSGVSVVIL